MLELAKNSLLKAKEDYPEFIIQQVKTPCYLISEDVLERNCKTLDWVQKKTGAKILLALKAYSLPATFPLLSKYLAGVCASGLFEAKLGREYFQKEVHTFSPAYKEEELEAIARVSDVIIFNTIEQLVKFQPRVKKINPQIQIGLRINPEYSEVEVELYNPCTPKSRFGVLSSELKEEHLSFLDGLHFHALCEQDSIHLEKVLNAVKEKFYPYLSKIKWLNLGGGHHITRAGYNIDLLIRLIKDLKQEFHLDIYLEPGEAVVLNAGVAVTSVLEVITREQNIAIVDISAENHLPDVLAMPYRPQIIGADLPQRKKYTYILGGPTCLAGDIIGTYSFDNPLKPGDKLVLTDMALYTFVKNTFFNGINLPSMATFNLKEKQVKLIREFSYADYKSKFMEK